MRKVGDLPCGTVLRLEVVAVLGWIVGIGSFMFGVRSWDRCENANMR